MLQGEEELLQEGDQGLGLQFEIWKMLLEEGDHVHVLLNHLQGADPIQDLQGKDHAQDLQVQWNLVHLQKGQIMEKDRTTMIKLLYMNLYLQDHWHLGEIQD